jgi:hypothetical protein
MKSLPKRMKRNFGQNKCILKEFTKRKFFYANVGEVFKTLKRI